MLTVAPHYLFRDATSSFFEEAPSFRNQLLKGVPYWRSVLDSACGIDVYGSNGIAVGDIDSDGWDEIYVCQPAGLPNRLYKTAAARWRTSPRWPGWAFWMTQLLPFSLISGTLAVRIWSLQRQLAHFCFSKLMARLSADLPAEPSDLRISTGVVQ